MLNVGLDFSTLKGKLTGSVDVFRRKRTGLPAKREDVLIPNEVGFSLPYENLNSDIHQGIDGSLMWRSSVNGFNYFVGGNFTFARQTDGEQYKPRFGNSLDQYRKSIYDRYAFLNWGLHSIGQFQSWEEIANYDIDNDRKGNSSLRPGDIKYEDINGDKVINELDERPIGYRQGGLPYFNYGINLGGQFKGFDLAMDFTGAAFASFSPSYEAVFPFHDGGNNPQYYMENQWMLSDITDPNSALIPGKYPTLIKGNRDHSNYWHSDFWLTNVNYLKLRNLQIGYTLPEKWMKPRGIQKLRIYTMMQNLFSIDNLGDMKIDPEITSDSGVQYPTNRVINVGVTLTF
ncbi:TonB dependent receptor [compost metagenome]